MNYVELSAFKVRRACERCLASIVKDAHENREKNIQTVLKQQTGFPGFRRFYTREEAEDMVLDVDTYLRWHCGWQKKEVTELLELANQTTNTVYVSSDTCALLKGFWND